MAQSESIEVTPEIFDTMRKSVKINKMYSGNPIYSRIIAKSTRTIKKYMPESPLDPIAVLWATLTTEEKINWENTAVYTGLNGYQYFVQEMTYRLANNIQGFPVLSNLHQYFVLKIELPNIYNDFNLYQPHTENIEFHTPNIAQKNARTWLPINESPSSPFLLEFSYFSDLYEVDELEQCEIEIYFYGTKDGSPENYSVVFPLLLQTPWIQFSEEISVPLDTISGYSIDIYFRPLRGVFMLDNFKLIYNSQNFVYNPFFTDKLENLYRHLYFSRYVYYSSWRFISNPSPIFAGLYYPQ